MLNVHLRRFAACLVLATMAVACTPAAAATFNPASSTLERRATAAPAFPYSPAEVAQVWNGAHHDKIAPNSAQAHQVAAYMNAVVYAKIRAYLIAVAARYAAALQASSCAPGNPNGCAALIESYFHDGGKAVQVARCESSLSPTASNGSYSGLFQQMVSAWSSRSAAAGVGGRSIYDPVANIRVSLMMVRNDGGWREWSCG